MPKRITVKVNIPAVEKLISEKGWSNAYFGEKVMGKSRGWIAEWKRGSCFPSPEEAARMCALLNATPEEILTEPDDIALVRGLIEREREQQSIKKGLPQGEAVELDAVTRELLDFVRNGTPEQKKDALLFIQFRIGKE